MAQQGPNSSSPIEMQLVSQVPIFVLIPEVL